MPDAPGDALRCLLPLEVHVETARVFDQERILSPRSGILPRNGLGSSLQVWIPPPRVKDEQRLRSPAVLAPRREAGPPTFKSSGDQVLLECGGPPGRQRLSPEGLVIPAPGARP